MADEQRETENGTVPEQTKGVNVKVYMGRDREEAFWNDVREYNEPMLSPGGVAQRLHCTRQFVSSLVKKGQLKALAFYLKEGSKPAYITSTFRQKQSVRTKNNLEALNLPLSRCLINFILRCNRQQKQSESIKPGTKGNHWNALG